MILSLTNGQEVNLHATWLLNKFAVSTKLKSFWERLGWLDWLDSKTLATKFCSAGLAFYAGWFSLMLKLLILNYEIVMVALMICVLFAT